ncbi:hypothetical protein HNY73_019096 [Argiope bruennichi]|uniref:Uncharacterized protein n=1 Tax=Argiope bruennichi TaxID=94029 RepID=A0A8T0EFD1_ARGBR|nr:hypothetical protein HNY73_019096 [Argiope bruennichi]
MQTIYEFLPSFSLPFGSFPDKPEVLCKFKTVVSFNQILVIRDLLLTDALLKPLHLKALCERSIHHIIC